MNDSQQTTAVGQPAHHAVRLPYLPGLDGLRAIAVIGVLLYHADLGVWGGFLGVESFFVLSGFLITALLLTEWREHGRIELRGFWIRRARRLLPALLLMLAGTLLLMAILLPEELGSFGRDALAALGYITNWYLIAGGQSYFDAVERPSLLKHLWSLAVEEQFYILWPLLFAIGMRFLRARGFLVVVVAAALASVALMAALYEPGADPSRIYYGTDTRAGALLLGAALALVWSPDRTAAVARPKLGLLLDGVGMLALVGLIAAYALAHEQHPLLYRGGLGLVAVGTAIAVAATTHPAARWLPRLLELPPLRWIGLRSYGIYLWHWPIFMVTRPGVDLSFDSWQVQALRFALALALAALSYRFVEVPVRAGALGRLWRALRQARAVPIAASAAQASQAAWRKLPGARQRRYRRWAPAMATSTLMLGVTCVAASVAQAAIGGPLLHAPQPSRAQTMATALPTAAATATHPAATSAPATTTAPSVGVAATIVPTVAAAPEPQIDQALAAELQRILDATVADGAIPGAVLAVHFPDGTTWSSASGLANRESGEAMATGTHIRIGSVSKMFTSVVVLQLVEEDVLDLDAPLDTWLPDLLPNGDAITVRQLLQHTSGLYDYLEDRRFVAEAYQEPARIWEPQELVDYATELPPSFEPGAEGRWDYSSTNYVVLGMLVEQVTGNTLAQELRKRILEPMELEHTYSVPEDMVAGPQARGYSKGDDQTDVAMSFAFATANIVTTVDDLGRFGSALFEDRLLEPESLALMQQFVDGKGQYAMPDLAYGLGMMRTHLPSDSDGRVIGHIGGFGGFRAALWYAPESDILVALSVNQASTDPNELAAQVFAALLG